MMQSQIAKNAFPSYRQSHVDFAAILNASCAPDEPFFFKAGYQLYRAVMLNLQTLRQINDAGSSPACNSPQREHQLVVLGFEPSRSGCIFAEVKKAADLITKLGQSLIVGSPQFIIQVHKS